MSLIDKEPSDLGAVEPIDAQQLVRQRAIKQIERRRRLHLEVVVGAIGIVLRGRSGAVRSTTTPAADHRMG